MDNLATGRRATCAWRFLPVLGVVAFTLIGGPAQAHTRGPLQPPSSQATFRSVAHGVASGVHARSTRVIRGADGWKQLWAEHEAGVTEKSDPPAVDFSNEIVVGVFLGDRPTGGYSVRILRVEESLPSLTVHYEEKHPAPGMMVTQMVTQPHHLVVVRTSATSVSFVQVTPQAERL